MANGLRLVEKTPGDQSMLMISAALTRIFSLFEKMLARLLGLFLPSQHLGRLIFSLQMLRWYAGVHLGIPVERFLECKYVIKHIKDIRGKNDIQILELGASGSCLSYELAWMGHHICSLDINKPFLVPLNFFLADMCNLCLQNETFDIILVISTLEHVGLGYYGDPTYTQGDLVALKEIKRTVKKGGAIFLTVPYHHPSYSSWQRLYDREAINELLFLSGLTVKEEAYYVFEKGWRRITSELANTASKFGLRCLACYVISKS